MTEAHMAIADSCYLLAEVNCLKSQVHELRASNRVTLEERARTAELLASLVTSTQLDAALSTKVSLAQVTVQMDAMRSKVAAQLAQKADLAQLISMLNTKLDVSIFNANAWDLHKLRLEMEQDARDLFTTFVAQVEGQVNTKIGIKDFIRFFDPEATGQETSLETAALRISKIMDQLELFNCHMNGDCQRQQRIIELSRNMLDLERKQIADRGAIVQLESARQDSKAQLYSMNKKTAKATAYLQSLAEMRHDRQEATLEEKSAQKAKQAQLANDLKQLQAHSENLTKKLSELEKFAHSELVSAHDIKLIDSNERLQNELFKASSTNGRHYQQLSERMEKATGFLLNHKEQLVKLGACVQKLASLLKETQGDLNAVKGPIATLAINLHEENLAILEEIERSQNVARNIMLDYQELLDRSKSTHVVIPLPSRPLLSRSSSTVSDALSASRKLLLKQQAFKAIKRPNTLKERNRTCSALKRASNCGARPAAGARTSSLPWRAETAGLVPQAYSNVTEPPTCWKQNGTLKAGQPLEN